MARAKGGASMVAGGGHAGRTGVTSPHRRARRVGVGRVVSRGGRSLTLLGGLAGLGRGARWPKEGVASPLQASAHDQGGARSATMGEEKKTRKN
jgi:hypothetical protein